MDERFALLEQRLSAVEAALVRLAPRPVAEVAEEACRFDVGSSSEGEYGPSSDVEHWDCTMEENEDELRYLAHARGYQVAQSVWDSCLLLGLKCLSRWDSMVVAFLVLLNMFAQFSFCAIVLTHMLSEQLDSNKLADLLRFRSGIAHDVKYADTITGRSLASQVCDLDYKLPWGSTQYDVVDKLRDYQSTGPPLCLLAASCWLALTLKELFESMAFMAAVMGQPTGRATIISLAKEAGKGEQQESSKLFAIVQMSAYRKSILIFAAALPRLAVNLLMMYTGLRFLANTLATSDLLLNALALGFILDLDELIMAAFAPRHAKFLISELGNLDVPHREIPGLRRFGSMAQERLRHGLKLMLLWFGILATYFLLLQPLGDRVQLAINILCSGQLDFVFTTNPTTGIVEATKSFTSNADLMMAQKTVLSLAHPDLMAVHGWTMAQKSLADLTRNATPALVRRATGEGEEDHPDQSLIRRLQVTSGSTVSEMATYLPCQDSAFSPRVVKAHLEALTNGRASDCKDLSQQEELQTLCSHFKMHPMRALCPQSCGCADPFEPASALFSIRYQGCPGLCHWARAGALKDHPVPCRDWDPQEFVSKPYMRRYIAGVFSMFSEQQEIRDAVAWQYATQITTTFRELLKSSNASQQISRLVKEFKSGAWRDELLDGKWILGRGIPHPRGLQGCAFWTSWEIKVLLGVDLCFVRKFHPIRMQCPVSCGCKASMDLCPTTCAR